MRARHDFISCGTPVNGRNNEIVLLRKHVEPHPVWCVALPVYVKLVIIRTHSNHSTVAIPCMTTSRNALRNQISAITLVNYFECKCKST